MGEDAGSRGALLSAVIAAAVAACAKSHPVTRDVDATSDMPDAGPARTPRCWAAPPTWSTQSVDPEGRAGASVRLAFDRSGRAHLGYRLIDHEVSVARVATETEAGWQIDDVARDVDAWVVLALGPSDEGHLVYSTRGSGIQAGGQAVHHAILSGERWSDTNIGTAHSYGPIGAAVDGSGRAHAAYYQCSSLFACYPVENAMVVNSDESGAWVEEPVAVSDESTAVGMPGYTTSFLAGGTDGSLSLLVEEFEHDRSNAQTGAALVLWDRTEDGWRRDVIASREGQLDYSAVLTIDGAGEPVVAFIEVIHLEGEWCGKDLCTPPPPPSPLVVARRRPSGWTFEELETLDSPWRIWDVDVDPSGAVVVLYPPDSRVPRLATNACGRWEFVDLDSEVQDATLSIDRVGRPTVAYFKSDPELGLWLATLQETFAE